MKLQHSDDRRLKLPQSLLTPQRKKGIRWKQEKRRGKCKWTDGILNGWKICNEKKQSLFAKRQYTSTRIDFPSKWRLFLLLYFQRLSMMTILCDVKICKALNIYRPNLHSYEAKKCWFLITIWKLETSLEELFFCSENRKNKNSKWDNVQQMKKGEFATGWWPPTWEEGASTLFNTFTRPSYYKSSSLDKLSNLIDNISCFYDVSHFLAISCFHL